LNYIKLIENMKKGFSIVELIVVVAILSIIVLIISQPVASIIKYQRESQTADNMRDNLQFIINKIEKELKTSSNVYVDANGVLKFKDQQGSPVTYSFADEVIKRNDKNFTDKTVFKIKKLNFIVTDKPNLSKLVTISIDTESLYGRDSLTMQTSINPVNDRQVITDGLTVLHLDAGNRNSYSGTSEARWVSLVNPAPTTTGIIRSGVTHSNNDGGYFRFDNNDYFNTQVPSRSTNYSASLWINMDYSNKDIIFARYGRYEFKLGGWFKNYYKTWTHLCITYDGSTYKLYLNGVYNGVNPIQIVDSKDPNELWLGGKGNISQVLVYDRVLDKSEVLYNYNADKGRFGIN